MRDATTTMIMPILNITLCILIKLHTGWTPAIVWLLELFLKRLLIIRKVNEKVIVFRLFPRHIIKKVTWKVYW